MDDDLLAIYRRAECSMMPLSSDQKILLAVVQESRGRWDTRNIDHYFHRRKGFLARSVLAELLALESSGLVVARELAAGTGPAWELTEAGVRELTERSGVVHHLVEDALRELADERQAAGPVAGLQQL